MLVATMTSAITHEQVLSELYARQPEHQIGPSLERISALVDLLGDPQRSAPVVQITGTNGKGSTAIMVDALLRAQGLRTGRYASPHLVDPVERINVDGMPVSTATFDEAWQQIQPYVAMVDDMEIDGIALTMFEALTGLAFSIFADAPVDVMVLEVGMGGAWDATNVVDADVAVVTPISRDHTSYLGETLAEIAGEKAGIIKSGSVAVLAGQDPSVAQVLTERCVAVGALALREGIDFGVEERIPGVGGQVVRITGSDGLLEPVLLPLYGHAMAENAALALAAVEALGGGRALSHEVVEAGFGDVVAPARTERVRTSPAVVLDTAHNPAAVASTMATMLEAFAFAPLIGVVGLMRDKEVREVLEAMEPDLDHVVVTQASTPRAIPADELAELAVSVFGEAQVTVKPWLPDALEAAVALADEAGPEAGVLVVGSAALAGEARALLVRDAETSAVADLAAIDEDEWESYGDDDSLGRRDWSDR